MIAFGGSYGGMLTAWARMKYPNIFIGGRVSVMSIFVCFFLFPFSFLKGLAASAPFGFYGTGRNEYAYMDRAQASYGDAAPSCDVKLGIAIQAVLDASNSAAGLQTLSKAFPTCYPLNTTSDGQNLLYWIQNALIYMVELDYDEVDVIWIFLA